MKKHFDIYKPVSPCTVIEHSARIGFKIEMTCGGGMGGSHWYIYVFYDDAAKLPAYMFSDDSVLILAPNELVKIKDINGENITINTNYVVTIKEIKILTVKFDTTEHVNFNKKICEKDTRIVRFELPKCADYTLSDEYCYNGNENEIIDEERETIK